MRMPRTSTGAPGARPRDLFISACNGHVLAFDNVSGLPAWISDTLWRLATGGGFAVRQLYTDQDEVLFDACRPSIPVAVHPGEQVASVPTRDYDQAAQGSSRFQGCCGVHRSGPSIALVVCPRTSISQLLGRRPAGTSLPWILCLTSERPHEATRHVRD